MSTESSVTGGDTEFPRNPFSFFNDTEKGLALTTSAAVHFLIRELDQLKNTNLYSQKLKQTANQFQKELEKHAHRNVWSDEVEGVDINAAADQMDQIAKLMHNFFILSFGCSEKTPAEQDMFWIDLNQAAKRHSMPIKMSIEGVLELNA